MKYKPSKVGDPCPHCTRPVIYQSHDAGWKPKGSQEYYFKWWLRCTECNYVQYFNRAKVWLTRRPGRPTPLD